MSTYSVYASNPMDSELKGSPDRSLEEYLDFAESLSREAGRVTRRYFGKRIDVELKEDSSPVTVADRETEAYIRDAIRSAYPEHGILGEEHGTVDSDSPYKWIIDPIDGTKSFITGIPLYTVLIALLKDDTPCVGVIHNPVLAETVAAASGLGCKLNGEPCSVSETVAVEEARLQITDPADLYRRYPDFTEKLFGKTRLCRSWGDGYGYLLLASGRADIMIDPILAIWDVAPLKVVVTEAGGVFTDFSGADIGLAESAIAANGELHKQVMRLLREEEME